MQQDATHGDVVLRAGTDHARVPPGGRTRVRLVCELSARGAPAEAARPPLACALALDVSGSMAGVPLAQVVRSVERIAELFRPEDALALVAFGNGATELSPLTRMDDAGKRLATVRARRLEAEGGTNVEAGLLRAARALESKDAAARACVLLLSDGAANVGAATKEALGELARGMRREASVSALGYGPAHDEDMLAAIADGGGGAYRFISDPSIAQREFALAVGAQADVVASSVELVVRPAMGVEIARAVGAPPSRFAAEGLVVPLADLIDGGTRIVVFELNLPAFERAMHAGAVAEVLVRWKAPGASDVSLREERVTIDLADGAPVLAPSFVAMALLARADEARSEARALADRGNWGGAAAVLRALMREIAAAPGYAAGSGAPLDEAHELLLDEAMAYERRPSAEKYNAFRKAMRSSVLSAGTAAVSFRGGREAARASLSSAGSFPEAYLVPLDPAKIANGAKVRLATHCTLGRTASADVVVVSDQVSRRHADVFALEGEFWLCDLGSMNPTKVNGAALDSRPHKLVHGDVITVGDVQIRYDEPPKKP